MVAQLLKGFVSILNPRQQVPQVVPVHGLHDLTRIQRTHAGGGRSAAQLPHSFLYQRLNLGKITLQHVHDAGLQVGRQVCQGQVWPSSSGLMHPLLCCMDLQVVAACEVHLRLDSSLHFCCNYTL